MNRIENISGVRNAALQRGKDIIKKSASEVIKSKHRSDHCKEHMKHEHGKNVN